MQPAYLVHSTCLECKLQIYLIHKALWGNFHTSYIQQSQESHQSEACSLASHRTVSGPREQEDSFQNPDKAPHPTLWPAIRLHPMVCLCLESVHLVMVNSIQEPSLWSRAGTHNERKPNATVTATINTWQNRPLSTWRSKPTWFMKTKQSFQHVWHVYGTGEKP